MDNGDNGDSHLLINGLTAVDSEYILQHRIDADHRRVRKDFVSGTDLDFLYDGWRMIEHRNSATQLPVGQYVFGNYLDELIEADINGGTLDETCTGTGDGAYFATQNALFSVYAMTRGQNSIHTAYSYDPYGGLTRIMDGNDGDITVNCNGNDTRTINATSVFFFCYTGQIHDNESGLYYYKERYYHPGLGRFVSQDPIGWISGINLYSYANHNPVEYTDPHGNQYQHPKETCPEAIACKQEAHADWLARVDEMNYWYEQMKAVHDQSRANCENQVTVAYGGCLLRCTPLVVNPGAYAGCVGICLLAAEAGLALCALEYSTEMTNVNLDFQDRVWKAQDELHAKYRECDKLCDQPCPSN
jgi:RHS repeat-associated protein